MAVPEPGAAATQAVTVRPLQEGDLPAADRIFRLAFGTFLGLPDPMAFMSDADVVRTRWITDPAATLGAELDGAIVGSNFAANWGSAGFFGPLSMHPDLWDRGIAVRLLEPTMDLFTTWGTELAGLFTFPQSPKHVHLYQKFDFWPQFLTAGMSKRLGPAVTVPPWSRYSELQAGDRESCLSACREVTDAIYPGLDLTREIRAVAAQGLGDTVLLWDAARLVGFAVCHVGANTEAGSGRCLVKFGAVRPGPDAERHFAWLLAAVEALAAALGARQLGADVNTARHAAYRSMIAHGFRTDMHGIIMHRRNVPGYNRPEVYALEDWR